MDPDVKWLAWFLGSVLVADALVVAAALTVLTLTQHGVVVAALTAVVSLVVAGLGSPLAGLYVADRAVSHGE